MAVPGVAAGGSSRYVGILEQIEPVALHFPEVRQVRFLPEELFQP